MGDKIRGVLTIPWVLAICAVASAVSGYVGHLLGRKASKEADSRAKQEELGRTIRWAIEQATLTGNELAARNGVIQLEVLLDDPLCTQREIDMIAAALTTVSDPGLEVIEAEGATRTEIEPSASLEPKTEA